MSVEDRFNDGQQFLSLLFDNLKTLISQIMLVPIGYIVRNYVEIAEGDVEFDAS